MARLKARPTNLCCSAEQIASSLSDLSEPGEELTERLRIWTELLDKWSNSQRLVGWRHADGLLSEGLRDAWAAVPLLSESEPRPIIDLGSGCGLPAIVFAAAYPSREVHLVEARRKRASFLQASVRALGLEQVRVHNARFEYLREQGVLPHGGVVTARAFAPPAAVLVAAQSLGASYTLLSVSKESVSQKWPAPWQEVARCFGAPRDRRVHALLTG